MSGGGFVKVPNWLVDHDDVGPFEIAAYVAIVKRLNRFTGQCNPSYGTIAEDAGMSPRRAQAAVLKLDELGAIERTVGQNRGGNCYALPAETRHEMPRSHEKRGTKRGTKDGKTRHGRSRNTAPGADEPDFEPEGEPDVPRARARENTNNDGTSVPQDQGQTQLTPRQEALQRIYGSPDYDDKRLSFKERDRVLELQRHIAKERHERKTVAARAAEDAASAATTQAAESLFDDEAITDPAEFGTAVAELCNKGATLFSHHFADVIRRRFDDHLEQQDVWDAFYAHRDEGDGADNVRAFPTSRDGLSIFPDGGEITIGDPIRPTGTKDGVAG